MVLRGEVSLDDPLSRHLPAPRPRWREREPTLLDLATHRSGLPNTPGPLGRRELAFVLGLRHDDPWAGITREAYERLVADESPRRRTRYSSLGVGLLGDALAARAGLPYEALLRDRVLAPLQLTSTSFTVSSVPGHSRRGRPRPPLQDLMPAAGSLRSNADDMLRFLAACLDPGPALAMAADRGLCWQRLTRRGRPTVIWHNGGTWGFRSFAGFVPERGRAAVVLSNTARGVDRQGMQLLAP